MPSLDSLSIVGTKDESKALNLVPDNKRSVLFILIVVIFVS